MKVVENFSTVCRETFPRYNISPALEKGKKRCQYLPPPEDDGQMQDIRDHILATPRDIEDLAQLGRELKTCPYYGSRRAIKQAEVRCISMMNLGVG